MDYGLAYTYIKDDPRWLTKLAIGVVVFLLSSFLIFPILFMLGYQIAVMRRVVDGEQHPLPEWTDWGRLFMDGLYVAIARFVYALPFTLVLCLGVGVFVVPALTASGSNEDLIAALVGIGGLVVVCLAILVAIALAFVTPAINIQYVRRQGDFGSLFRFGEVLGIARDNLVNILLVIVSIVVANFVLQLITSLSVITICGPFIVPFIGYAWIQWASAHLYGQMASPAAKEKVGYA